MAALFICQLPFQISVARADLLERRQAHEHARVPETEGAGRDPARRRPEDAEDQPGLQAADRLQVRSSSLQMGLRLPQAKLCFEAPETFRSRFIMLALKFFSRITGGWVGLFLPCHLVPRGDKERER